MNEIKSFYRKNLRNNEYLSFNREVESVLSTKDTDVLDISDTYIDFQQALQTFDDCILRVMKSLITGRMGEMDAKRNNFFVGINEKIRIATRHFDATIKIAGKSLMPVVNTFKDSNLKSFDNKSGIFSNYIEELRKKVNEEFVETLALTPWIAQLEIANRECIVLTSNRTHELIEKTASGRAIDARHATDHAYNALVERINALILLRGDTLYGDTISYINGRIDHYCNTLAHRPSKARHKGNEGETPQETT